MCQWWMGAITKTVDEREFLKIKLDLVNIQSSEPLTLWETLNFSKYFRDCFQTL